MPGVEIHANAIQQMLNADYIQMPTGTLEYKTRFNKDHLLIISLFIVVTLLLVTKTPPIWGFVIMAVELIIWVSYSIGAFLTDYLWLYKLIAGQEINVPGLGESAMIPILFPAAAIVLPYGLNLTYKLFTEGQDKAFLKAAFGNYISPELIDEMFDSKQKPELGGNAAMRTAYFTDIASFSTFSELLTASELVILLNEYLTSMTDILLNGGGTLDKYEGDAIIAFFGAPVDQPDNALLALKVGVNMQQACDDLRKKWTSEGDKWPEIVKQMRTRIGINHGDLVCGNMGAENRMNYTMMGDTVNTAARLEEGAKQYGIYLATTIETLQAAGKDEFEWRIVDKTRYMGKSEATTTVEILGFKGGISDDLAKAIEIFNEGFELYQKMDWDGAIGKFTESEKYEEEFVGRPNTPSRRLIDRCNEYKEEPPVSGDNDWDGVFTMTKK
jgi:adenylate cyclase